MASLSPQLDFVQPIYLNSHESFQLNIINGREFYILSPELQKLSLIGHLLFLTGASIGGGDPLREVFQRHSLPSAYYAANEPHEPGLEIVMGITRSEAAGISLVRRHQAENQEKALYMDQKVCSTVWTHLPSQSWLEKSRQLSGSSGMLLYIGQFFFYGSQCCWVWIKWAMRFSSRHL